MILTLEVTGPQAQEMGAGARKVFKAIGGTIGRLPDNDWVFQDPYVSGRHALVRYVNGKFFVEDTSTNGVFINSPENRLSRGQPQLLRDGDLLYIDAYQINVSIQNDVTEDVRDPFAVLKNGGPKLVPPPKRTPAPVVAAEDRTENMAVERPHDRNGTVVQMPKGMLDDDEDEEEEDDEESGDERRTEWFGVTEMAEPKHSAQSVAASRARPEVVKSTVAVPTPASRADAGKSATVALQPPRADAGKSATVALQPPPRPSARIPPPPAAKVVPSAVSNAGPKAASQTPAPRARSEQNLAPTGTNVQLQALLDAAGIEGLEPNEETARVLGELLRISLGGVMEALRTRERMKDDLRMRGTSFKAADNNPLKFSANVDDAFHNLLVKHNPAYLQPIDAFEDAFRDVREHQSAFLAAMRLAFESMLSQFDPQRMQEEFDRQMKGSILGVPAKLRYWDLYRDKYGELSKDAEVGFRTLFGDAFGRAYEEHLERLKKSGRPIGQ
ncbi:type VI secretion system-associated FHA domain protein TagH [Steroidobacter sp.]|uniref:type VI secretion system-associated FHA domain protein TagH n=1 Tax=Steroidobacter sp. TaxID=1978227 RepID=UPI001A3B2CFE|nr:type VI secretion system-associated FHA domain protein TagH [Steroidobacter sp.]MBL8264802.1 type VI secretion system-associated FHA domain protein TagH [Steroidobacter sp.]